MNYPFRANSNAAEPARGAIVDRGFRTRMKKCHRTLPRSPLPECTEMPISVRNESLDSIRAPAGNLGGAVLFAPFAHQHLHCLSSGLPEGRLCCFLVKSGIRTLGIWRGPWSFLTPGAGGAGGRRVGAPASASRPTVAQGVHRIFLQPAFQTRVELLW